MNRSQSIRPELLQFVAQGNISAAQLKDWIAAYNELIDEHNNFNVRRHGLSKPQISTAEMSMAEKHWDLTTQYKLFAPKEGDSAIRAIFSSMLDVFKRNKGANMLSPIEYSENAPTHQVSSATVTSKVPTTILSEKGLRELAKDLQIALVTELESVEGVNKLPKSAISVIPEKTSNALSIVLANSVDRAAPVATAFREMLGKLEAATNPPDGFKVTRRHAWSPEPAVIVREELARKKLAAPILSPSDRCPLTFTAKEAQDLIEGLNAALGEGNKLNSEKYTDFSVREARHAGR